MECARSEDDQIIHDGRITLMNHVDPYVFLIWRMCSLLGSDIKTAMNLPWKFRYFSQPGGKRPPDLNPVRWKTPTMRSSIGEIIPHVGLICGNFLQEVISRQNSFSCRQRLIEIVAWIISFDSAILENFDRPWIEFEGVAESNRFVWEWDDGYKDQDAFEYAQDPEFSVQEVCKGLDLKNIYLRQYDIFLTLHHGFESQCSDFARDTSSNLKFKDRVDTKLSRGILHNLLFSILPRLDDQVLRALGRKLVARQMICRKASTWRGIGLPDLTWAEMRRM